MLLLSGVRVNLVPGASELVGIMLLSSCLMTRVVHVARSYARCHSPCHVSHTAIDHRSRRSDTTNGASQSPGPASRPPTPGATIGADPHTSASIRAANAVAQSQRR